MILRSGKAATRGVSCCLRSGILAKTNPRPRGHRLGGLI